MLCLSHLLIRTKVTQPKRTMTQWPWVQLCLKKSMYCIHPIKLKSRQSHWYRFSRDRCRTVVKSFQTWSRTLVRLSENSAVLHLPHHCWVYCKDCEINRHYPSENTQKCALLLQGVVLFKHNWSFSQSHRADLRLARVNPNSSWQRCWYLLSICWGSLRCDGQLSSGHPYSGDTGLQLETTNGKHDA